MTCSGCSNAVNRILTRIEGLFPLIKMLFDEKIFIIHIPPL